MAKALTFRQLAKIFQKQSDIQSKLSVQLMKDANAANTALPTTPTVQQYNDVNNAYDNCVRAYYIADGMQQSADAANAAADAAGEPA